MVSNNSNSITKTLPVRSEDSFSQEDISSSMAHTFLPSFAGKAEEFLEHNGHELPTPLRKSQPIQIRVEYQSHPTPELDILVQH